MRAPSTRSSCTSVAMCTSSVATPAASSTSPSRSVDERKQSSGRRRFPPAASASVATDEANPSRRSTARARRASSSAMYAARPGVAPTEARAFTGRPCATPVCRAMIEPASRRNSTLGEARRAHQRGELLGGREPRDRRRQVGVGGAAGQQPPERGTIRSNQSEKNGRSAPRGRVISRIASRPPGRGARAAARRAPRSRSETFRIPKPIVAASNVPGVERQLEQVADHPLERRRLAPRPREHPLARSRGR